MKPQLRDIPLAHRLLVLHQAERLRLLRCQCVGVHGALVHVLLGKGDLLEGLVVIYDTGHGLSLGLTGLAGLQVSLTEGQGLSFCSQLCCLNLGLLVLQVLQRRTQRLSHVEVRIPQSLENTQHTTQ